MYLIYRFIILNIVVLGLSACNTILTSTAQKFENDTNSGSSSNSMNCGELKSPICRPSGDGREFCRCE